MTDPSKTVIRGSLAQVIAQIAALPKGRPLSEVLKIVQSEIDSPKVHVSRDLRRATLETSTGRLISVRVTAARQTHAGLPQFRFKPPRDLKSYQILYFGGLNLQGKAVVHRFSPREIGTRQTLTLRAGTK
jgi:hypothetical protein